MQRAAFTGTKKKKKNWFELTFVLTGIVLAGVNSILVSILTIQIWGIFCIQIRSSTSTYWLTALCFTMRSNNNFNFPPGWIKYCYVMLFILTSIVLTGIHTYTTIHNYSSKSSFFTYVLVCAHDAIIAYYVLTHLYIHPLQFIPDFVVETYL